ncbi:MAG: alpha/beta hydrolase [Bacteroidetes bacterium]|nr:alpha/beta hydrolase [Bacteroidota bacterium]
MKKLKQKYSALIKLLHIKILTVFSKRKAAEKALQIFRTPAKRSRKEWTELFKKAEKKEFEFNGITIRGFRWNNPGKRKALILHGHESTVLNFEIYIKGLLDKGYEVLAFDAPAHGISEGETLNVLDYRDFIIHIHNQFGPVQSYLGHSFGGLAIPLALEKIQHNNTFRIALIAPATETTTTINRYFRLLRVKNEKVKKHFEDLIQEIDGNHSSWYSVSRALPNIKAAIIWAHDEDDPVTPFSDALKVKEQNYPNIQFVITKGLGHNLIYREEKVAKQVIDFL